MTEIQCINRGIWHGMILVENPTVPADGYVITDNRNVVLAGGNLKTNEVWKTDRDGEGRRIQARRDVIDMLITNASKVDTAREETTHGSRFAH
jgi:hypothetical protein